MTQNQLRTSLSFFLICTHLSIPLLIFIVYLSDGFTKSELVELLKIIIPMVSALSGVAITYIIRTQKASDSRRKGMELSRHFVYAAVGFPVLFVIVILCLVLLKCWNIGLRSFTDLKSALAIAETVFGTYTGQLMASLFEQEKPS